MKSQRSAAKESHAMFFGCVAKLANKPLCPGIINSAFPASGISAGKPVLEFRSFGAYMGARLGAAADVVWMKSWW